METPRNSHQIVGEGLARAVLSLTPREREQWKRAVRSNLSVSSPKAEVHHDVIALRIVEAAERGQS